jgi:hypothetical protein
VRAELGQQAARGVQRQLGIDGVVLVGRAGGVHAHAGHFGQEQQLVGLELDRHAGGHFFHAEVEGLARGREAEGRDQHHGFGVQALRMPSTSTLRTRPECMKSTPSTMPTGRAVRKLPEITHARTGHGRVGQALAEGGFDLVAQLAGRFLGAVQRNGVGDSHAVVVTRLLALEAQLLVDLGRKPCTSTILTPMAWIIARSWTMELSLPASMASPVRPTTKVWCRNLWI